MVEKIERIWTVDELADYLGLHRNTICAWIHADRIKAVLLPGKKGYRIRQREVDRILGGDDE